MTITDVQTNHVLHSEDGKFTTTTTSKPADVDRVLDRAAAAAPPSGLVLHFHGGLNSQKVGREIADRLAPEYGAAGAYPLFFVWESGLLETLRNNLSEIAKDAPLRELVKKACEWALKKAGGGVLSRKPGALGVDEAALRADLDRWFAGELPRPRLPDLPIARGVGGRGTGVPTAAKLAQEIADGLEADPAFRAAFEGLIGVRGRGTGGRVLLDRAALEQILGTEPGTKARGVFSWLGVAKLVAGVVIAVIKRRRLDRDHGLYCTVVEEVLRAAYLDLLGATVWLNMKRDTADSFGADPACCGARVVEGLAARAGAFPKITLVGHSTGAVFICEFLDAAARAAPAQAFDVVFLAPAVTHQRFAEALGRHASRIANFRAFAMTDALEADDVLVPVLYSRSLLYFVSGLLEGEEKAGAWVPEVDAPLVGMKRFLDPGGPFETGFPAVDAVKAYLAADPRRAVWSVANQGDGRRSQAKKHGDFDNDPATVESVKHILSQGF